MLSVSSEGFFFGFCLIAGVDPYYIYIAQAADCLGNINAQRVLGYGIFKDGKHIQMSYPLEKFHADVVGSSFHNGHFIQRMREKAASLPK